MIEDHAERMVKLQSGLLDDQEFALKTAQISRNQKLAYYKEADYCFLTTKEMLPILRAEMDSLLRDGDIYYSIFDRNSNPEQQIVVLFFADDFIDR